MAKNLSAKKRAIYTGLYPYLDTDNLMQAMVIWEQKYADNPSFAVQHFINDICSDNNLKSLRRDMLLNLVKTLVMPEKDLMADPSIEIDHYKKAHNIVSVAQYTSRELLVFQRLVIAMMEQVTVDIRISIKDFVLEHTHKDKIDHALKRQLQLWLSKQTTSMKVAAVEVEGLRHIINFFYVGFCEYLGPVETDRLLGKAVAKVTDNHSNDYTAIMRTLL